MIYSQSVAGQCVERYQAACSESCGQFPQSILPPWLPQQVVYRFMFLLLSLRNALRKLISIVRTETAMLNLASELGL